MSWTAGIGVFVLYVAAWPHTNPELHDFNFRWIEHIRSHGSVAAFAVPFSNYNPPYLYLLAALSPLPLPVSAINKLSAYIGVAWFVLSIWQIAKSAGVRKPTQAALLSLLVPSLVINAGLLAQTDAFWVAPCLLAVAAALDRRWLALSAWAGLAFAFKAQAVFLAPFVAGILIRERAWTAFLAAPLAYVLALAPAWSAGWPLLDLLTVYFEQAKYPGYFSNAPNPWSVIFYKQKIVPDAATYAAFGLAGASAVWVAFLIQRERSRVLELALLSALLMPWLLPRMHERYFMLADFLAFALACRRSDRRGWLIFAAIEVGSFCSLVGYGIESFLLNGLGAVPMTIGLALLLHTLATPHKAGAVEEAQKPVPEPLQSPAH